MGSINRQNEKHPRPVGGRVTMLALADLMYFVVGPLLLLPNMRNGSCDGDRVQGGPDEGAQHQTAASHLHSW